MWWNSSKLIFYQILQHGKQWFSPWEPRNHLYKGKLLNKIHITNCSIDVIVINKKSITKKICKCMNMFIKMITKTFYWKIVTVLSNINACLSSFNSQHGGGADLEWTCLPALCLFPLGVIFLFDMFANKVYVASAYCPLGMLFLMYVMFSLDFSMKSSYPGIFSDFMILSNWATLNLELWVDSPELKWHNKMSSIASMSLARNPLIFVNISWRSCNFHANWSLSAWSMIEAVKFSTSRARRSRNIENLVLTRSLNLSENTLNCCHLFLCPQYE